MIYAIAIIAGLMGLLFGYDEGVIAGTLKPIVADFTLSHSMIGVMSGALPLGALLGSSLIASLVAGKLLQKFGRRMILFVAALLFILGAIFIIIAFDYAFLIFSRIILGCAIGGASVATPLYVSETAPMEIRGKLVTIYQLSITFGILLSYVLVYLIGELVSWKVFYGIAVIPAALVAIIIFMLPESPRWLMVSGRQDKAKKSMRRLQPRLSAAEIDKGYDEIQSALNIEKRGSFADLFKANYRPILIMGVLLFMLQQLSGINAIIYYAPIIFTKMGFKGFATDILATIGIGIVNFGTTFLALYYVEKIGRRKLLIFGFFGTALSLFVIFITARAHVHYLNWISFGALIFYIFSFAISLGPLPFVYTSEIFPLKVRAAGMGMSAISNWFFNAVVVFLFPIISTLLSVGDTFAMFGAICVLGGIYAIFFAPETKGLSLEAIQEHVDMGKPLRSLGR